MANIQMQCLSERFITFTELNKNANQYLIP